MPLIHVLVVLVVVGVILWVVNTYVPMDAKIKRILNIVVVIVVSSGYCVPSGSWTPSRGFASGGEF